MRISKKSSLSLVGMAVLVTALLLVLTLLASVVVQAQSGKNTKLAPGQRLVTIYDQGEKRSVITEANTVGDTLSRAGITLLADDIVEPSQETEFSTTDYNINIYRAKPVMIVDGLRREKIMSPYGFSRDIIKHSQITLHDEDIVTTELSQDPLDQGAGIQLQIKRSTPLQLMLYGKKEQIRTQAKTVNELLAEKHITLAQNDTISVEKTATIKEGMNIEIWRNGKQTITEEQEIPFPVRRIQDADKKVGFREVKTPGKNGRKSVTYEVIMKNGQEVDRKEIQSVELDAPSEQVEVVGTKYQLPPGSHEDWMRAAGINPSDFGYVNAIFQQESGWNPASRNPNGMYVGLGQTNPGKLSSSCPSWQTDPVCQIQFFDGYKGRYGSWKAAYEFKFGVGGRGGAGWW